MLSFTLPVAALFAIEKTGHAPLATPAQRAAAHLHAANMRLAGQLPAVRACTRTHHLRPCLRRALR